MDNSLLDRNRKAEETGRWWEIPFWRNPRYVGLDGAAAENIEQAFVALARIYDDKWFLDRAYNHRKAVICGLKSLRASVRDKSYERFVPEPRHPVYLYLCSDGPVVIIPLLRHGLALLVAARLGLLPSYKDRLRDPNNYNGAWFELDLIRLLDRERVQILPPAAGAVGKRKCEFLARAGMEDLYIEAKYRSPAPENTIVSQLEGALHHVLVTAPSTHGKAYVNGYEALPAFRAAVLEGEGPKGFRHRWPDLAKEITAHLEDVVERKAWGVHEIPGLVRYRVVPITEGMSYQGQGGGLRPSKDAEVQKIIQSGIAEAHAQLPIGTAGLLIVYSSAANRFRLKEEDFREAFGGRASLGGLIVLDGVQPAQFVPNSSASIPISNFAVVRALLQPTGRAPWS